MNKFMQNWTVTSYILFLVLYKSKAYKEDDYLQPGFDISQLEEVVTSTWYLLPVACYMLSFTCYMLPVTFYLLPVTC